MACTGGTRARRRSQPQEKGWGRWEGAVWSPGRSLTLRKLQSANEKRGAFWVISLSEETPIYVLSLGEMGIKIDGASPVCHVLGQAPPSPRSHWSFTITLRSRSYLSYFTDEKSEA